MNKGTVARKMPKGFGFIKQEDGTDLFFHASELVDIDFDTLQEGDEVTFEIGQGPKGPNATQVRKA